VPREGRFRLRHDGRTLTAVATALPGLQGDAHRLLLLEERIQQKNLSEMLEGYPGIREAIERSLSQKKGLLLLAAPEEHHRKRILRDLVAFLEERVGAEGPIVAPEVRTATEVSDLFQAAAARLDGVDGCFANVGCRVCRGAGALDLEPVFEFLPGSLSLAGESRSPKASRERRRDLARAGVKTLFSSAMGRAAAGELDVREP